jgi:hypothetical protein
MFKIKTFASQYKVKISMVLIFLLTTTHASSNANNAGNKHVLFIEQIKPLTKYDAVG